MCRCVTSTTNVLLRHSTWFYLGTPKLHSSPELYCTHSRLWNTECSLIPKQRLCKSDFSRVWLDEQTFDLLACWSSTSEMGNNVVGYISLMSAGRLGWCAGNVKWLYLQQNHCFKFNQTNSVGIMKLKVRVLWKLWRGSSGHWQAFPRDDLWLAGLCYSMKHHQLCFTWSAASHVVQYASLYSDLLVCDVLKETSYRLMTGYNNRSSVSKKSSFTTLPFILEK